MRSTALLTFLVAALGVRETRAETLEYPVKAAFLYQFARFTEWPRTDASGPLCVGVLGADPFGSAIDRALEGKAVGNRPVEIRRSVSLEDLQSCPVLFVSRSETHRLADILPRASAWSLLTVGESDDFTRAGGMVRFFVDGRRIRFEINLAAVQGAALHISSRVLAIAEVTGGEGGGR